jgi:WD40 repeat protein
VLAELNAHRSSVAHLDFSADGTMLVSSSWDGTMRIWGVGATD